MTDPRIIPWKRIFVEGVAIVISILLAFAIEAWWSQREESDSEHRTLQALQRDLMASNEALDRLLLALARVRTDFARFQSATPAELTKIDPEAVRPILVSLVTPASFEPVTATHDALSSDGRLGLISDPELLTHLSNWQRDLDDLEENSTDLHAESVRVLRSMEIHGGPFIRWRRSLDDLEVLQRADGEVLAALRQDADFMGKARMHQYTLSGYLLELRRLDESLDAMLVLLDEILTQH